MSVLEYKLFSNIQEQVIRASDRKAPAGRQFQTMFDILIEKLGVNRTVEIGAFEASFSRRSVNKPSIKSSVAFEANPDVYNHYREECESDGVDYRNNCVALENGTIEISIPTDFNGRTIDSVNQIASLMKNQKSENFRTVAVPAVNLDTALGVEKSDKFALWVDVEGAASQVLPAAKSVLQQTALVMIEVESKPLWEGQWLDTDIYEFMSKAGFSPIARDIQRPNQYNVIYEANSLQNEAATLKMIENYVLGRGRF